MSTDEINCKTSHTTLENPTLIPLIKFEKSLQITDEGIQFLSSFTNTVINKK